MATVSDLAISAPTLDDLIHDVFELMLRSTNQITPTANPCREEIGVILELTNPRARLSRSETRGKMFSALGEFLWYLSYSDDLDFISYYIDFYKKLYPNGGPVTGAYGPRLKSPSGQDQNLNVLNVLSRPDSRRAVIQIFAATDIVIDHRDTPCTCTLQFFRRDERLHLMAHMRSNDVYLGLPHDVFSFTMIQELLARKLGLEVGIYKHAVGSLHLYDRNRDAAQSYLDEGFQPTVAVMPTMPDGDPFPELDELIILESKIRTGDTVNLDECELDPYWLDLARLIQLYSCNDSHDQFDQIRKSMSSKAFDPYIERLADRRLGQS